MNFLQHGNDIGFYFLLYADRFFSSVVISVVDFLTVIYLCNNKTSYIYTPVH